MNEKNIETNEVLLARIDERTQRLEKDFVDFKAQLTSNFVTKDEFMPVKSLVYGGVAISLTTVVTAVLYLVMKGN